MSTTLPDGEAIGSLEPVTHAELVAYFHNGGKPESAWRVGAEFEAFLIERTTGRALSYAEPGGICSILQCLVDQFGWHPQYRAGRLTMLSRAGATVSMEPGGQLEFSSPPVSHIGELETELRRYRTELHTILDHDCMTMIAAGVTPFARVEEIPPPVRRRHQLMAEYLPARCPMAQHMMLATASTQAAFDYADEADAMRKFTTALTLGPVLNAIWGNSPLYGGESTGWVSYRGRIWLGMDPDRSGLLSHLLADGLSFDRWVEYLLDVPLIFIVRDAEYRKVAGQSFRYYMNHGIDERFPTLADWEVHLTTVFPEVRLKQFLEVRGADANSHPLALTVPTLWKGLLYDRDALTDAEAIAKHFPPTALTSLFELAARDGLNAEWGGHSFCEWATELTEISKEGLRRQAARTGQPDERRFLDPVDEVLARGTSPGAELAAAHPFTVSSVLARIEV